MALFRTIATVVTVVCSLIAGEIFPASKVKPMEVAADEVASLELKLKSDPDNPVLLQGLGRYYSRVGRIRLAEECAQRLLEHAEKTGDREFSEMWGRCILGAAQTSQGLLKEALRNLEIARTIAESEEDRSALSMVYNTMGIFYMFNNNDPFTATAFYYKALDTVRKENDFQKEAPLLANLAAAYLIMEDPSGVRLAEQAVELSEKYDPEFTIKPLIILAETYVLADSTAKARKTLEKIRMDESESLTGEFAATLQFIEAELAVKEGRLDEGISIFRTLLPDYSDDPSWVASVSLELAAALEKKGFEAEAISILEKALRNSRDKNVHVHSSKMMKALVRLYAKTGRKDDAIALGEDYVAYSDSLYTFGHHRTMQENRIREEVFSKEREIDEQKLQLASKNHKILLLAIGFGLLCVLLLFIFYANRRKERLYKTIVARNSEFLQRDRRQNEEILALRQKINQQVQEDKAVFSDPSIEQKADCATGGEAVSIKELDTNRELMERFVEYLETEYRYTDPQITVAGVAKELGSNRTYLSKAINAATGKTFIQIINDYRMRRAVELLSDRNSDMPLKQLSAGLGYNSMSTFYTIFNNYTGMTPAKYREHVRRIADDNPEDDTES